jgi:hypothetical protein
VAVKEIEIPSVCSDGRNFVIMAIMFLTTIHFAINRPFNLRSRAESLSSEARKAAIDDIRAKQKKFCNENCGKNGNKCRLKK